MPPNVTSDATPNPPANASSLAALQRGVVFGVGCLALGWVGWAASHAQPWWWILAGALLIGLAHAWILALEFVLLSRVVPGQGVPKPAALTLLKAWWGEIWTGLKVFGWRQPFRSAAMPDQPVSPQEERDLVAGPRGVVLVHGFVCNRGLWNPWMQRLRQRGIPYIAVNLEPVFGSIDNYPATVGHAVRQLQAVTGRPPLIVAHSMGGLAVRAWLAAGDGSMDGLEVITIGTPHHGTWLARFGATPNARQMQRHGPWLQALAAREAPGLGRRFTCFFGHCDNIVFPADTATLPGADNRHLPGVAHVHMVYRPEVFAEVLARLRPT